ncbi:chromosome segregation protein SMC [Phaeovibrio sulfidiphilus]|uniref:Chromosome partition protein Smc n=1 Tax=Phaeovibrio sulfidiphilus TaxID=1220600 RepID=A0A8J7CCW1_9PROT|nr:chromosome segregation protein SMC [Phaeovibrio sulfidiphilus]MBE1237413.1 chromosome segregation protein SMC [Phaeovibrio sulfidiphilus]
MLHVVRLRLVGFKSFVEAADLQISDGLTGIVGPNGCGKSNVVEALRWVMGETSARQLRGGEMDDVIFGGTSARPARNLAEVTLLLDNREHTAPPLFNTAEELEVTRRIRRGEGSVYRVNGKEVRARDVQLLFADMSSGARSAAIVSQGRVAALIGAKPIQRRALLEEAAGIAGLHTRRQEAQSRLAAAEANLERLDDVVGTLRNQLNSLARQARQAARYRTLSEKLHETESIVLRLRWVEGLQALDTARRVYAEREREAATASAAATAAGHRQNELSETFPPLRVAHGELSARIQRLSLAREQLEAEDRAIQQSRRENLSRLAQAENDARRERERLADARKALADLDAEEQRLRAALDESRDTVPRLEQRLGELTRDAATLEEHLSAATRALAEHRARDDAEKRLLAQARSQAERLRSRLGDARRERDTLEAATVPTADLEAARQATAQADAAADAARSALEEAESALGTARTTEAQARSALQDAESTFGQLDAEARGLQALLRPAQTRGTADAPPLVDQLRPVAGVEKALAGALGDDLHASLTDGAAVCWRDLDGSGAPAGGSDGGDESDSASKGSGDSSGDGADGKTRSPALPALPEGTRPLAGQVDAPAALSRILGATGIADSAEDAAARQWHLMPGQQLVDPEGGLWRWDGLVRRPGARDSARAAAARLETRNRLEALETRLDSARQERDALAASAREAAARLETATARERTCREALRQADRECQQARDRAASLERRASEAGARLNSLEDTLAHLAADLAPAEAECARLEQALAARGDDTALVTEQTARKAALDALRETQRSVQSELDRARQADHGRRRRLSGLAGERASWQERHDQATRQATDFETRQQQARTTLATLDGQPDVLAERKATLQDDIAALEAERKSLDDELARAETLLREAGLALKEAQKTEARAREALIRAESAVEQGRSACQEAARQIAEKRQCSPEELVRKTDLPPDADLPALEVAERELLSLGRERDALGPVNLCADQEAGELTSQVDTLDHERTDLVEAIARLRQAISELNKEGRARLLDSFARVDEHFQRLFARLFGGGKAHLTLVEDSDPLEAGLEIMASPPGKRLQSLSLLSGGEQALTALALLFAVFLTNPAPICVLDEVDAPLDDANVDRLCTMLQELTEITRTRFLVVTHHRMTMARMDRLYGVTMVERGVSSLVSVDLKEAERLAGEDLPEDDGTDNASARRRETAAPVA